jgi:hypothetical protein
MMSLSLMLWTLGACLAVCLAAIVAGRVAAADPAESDSLDAQIVSRALRYRPAGGIAP